MTRPWVRAMTNLRFGVVLCAAIVASAAGCGGRVEGGDIEFVYTVDDAPGGNFSFETVTVVEQDVTSHHASLTSVTLEVVSPSGATLAFLSDVVAAAESGSTFVDLVSLAKAPQVSSFPLDIVYHGDLQPFFPDGHTIHVRWRGRVDPSFGPLPKGGITVRCRIGISS